MRHRLAPRRRRRGGPSGPRLAAPALALAAWALAACGSPTAPPAPQPPDQLADPVRLTGGSPYPAGCNPPIAGRTVYLGAEAEPYLAIDPGDPHHLVAAWQQDRWIGGGANGTGSAASFDGGLSWARSDPPFTFCSGGTAAGGAFQRASDPWVSIGPDGTVYAVALAFDNPWSGASDAILASRSADGGRSWSSPAVLQLEPSTDAALDKCSLTADRTRPGHAYAVWDRLSGLEGPDTGTSGPAMLARTSDGGASWQGPWVLYDPGLDAQTIASQIVVLPDGVLVDLLVVVTGLSTTVPSFQVAVLRSEDAEAPAGPSWTGPFLVSPWHVEGVKDPSSGHGVRAGDVVPTVAVDAASGALYAAWQDGRFGGCADPGLGPCVDGIAFSRSLDGGVTWAPPVQVNGDHAVPAFTPSLAVAGNGRVGLGYFDWREQPTGSGPGLWTTRWLATSADGGATWAEAPAGGPFDLRRAPDVPGYFLGDYMGLVGGPDGFTSLLTMSVFGGAAGQTDVYAGPAQP